MRQGESITDDAAALCVRDAHGHARRHAGWAAAAACAAVRLPASSLHAALPPTMHSPRPVLLPCHLLHLKVRSRD